MMTTLKDISKSFLIALVVIGAVFFFFSVVWPILLVFFILAATLGLVYWVYSLVSQGKDSAKESSQNNTVDFPSDWEITGVEEAEILD